MGGLALKNTYTRRYSNKEFEIVSKELISILEETFDRAEVPLYFSSKESFGDIDIILSMDGFNQNMKDYINETFEPNEIFHNGNAWSFDYKEIQVDLITCAPEDFDSNRHYLAYNDLGNFIGRITQKLGLKYGQEGLWYNHYFKGQRIGKVMISKDYPKIFEFLGFDYDRWLEGFETLEDIFEYVIANKHFDSKMFELHNLNKINRERNAKRKSYMSFLEYIAENHSDRQYFFENDKSVYVDRANKFFPEARMTENIRKLEYLHCRKLYIKSKFSGGVVMSRYGLQGKELGKALSGFKEWMVEKEWITSYDDFILTTSTDDIYGYFERYYRENII
jgi:hypothetical protein